jgi:hypothetical protein
VSGQSGVRSGKRYLVIYITGAFTTAASKFYNVRMNVRQKHVYLPAASAAGCFIGLLFLLFFTNPLVQASYSLVFVLLLGVFLSSLAYLLIFIQSGTVSHKSKFRIAISVSLLISVIMLRSTQSLGAGDAAVIILIFILVYFYTSRRYK